jgi:hypothetical protein
MNIGVIESSPPARLVQSRNIAAFYHSRRFSEPMRDQSSTSQLVMPREGGASSKRRSKVFYCGFGDYWIVRFRGLMTNESAQSVAVRHGWNAST